MRLDVGAILTPRRPRSGHPDCVDYRHPASERVSKWGLVHGWLVIEPARRIEMRAGNDGFVVSVEDPEYGGLEVSVAVDEDPSAATWRAITRLNASGR